jgi:hypothetical protein
LAVLDDKVNPFQRGRIHDPTVVDHNPAGGADSCCGAGLRRNRSNGLSPKPFDLSRNEFAAQWIPVGLYALLDDKFAREELEPSFLVAPQG